MVWKNEFGLLDLQICTRYNDFFTRAGAKEKRDK
jgi:hypothetical protein